MEERITYPSGELQLEIARSEYENEQARISVLDSKVNTVISLAAVFFVAISQILDLKQVLAARVTYFCDAILPSILLITMIGAIVLVFLSLVAFLKVIFTKTYIAIDPMYFYELDKWKAEKDVFCIAASYFYIKATANNKKVNDARVKQYRIGIILLTISAALFGLYSILSGAISF